MPVRSTLPKCEKKNVFHCVQIILTKLVVIVTAFRVIHQKQFASVFFRRLSIRPLSLARLGTGHLSEGQAHRASAGKELLIFDLSCSRFLLLKKLMKKQFPDRQDQEPLREHEEDEP